MCILGLGERIGNGRVRRPQIEDEEIEKDAERVTTVGDDRGASTCERKERDRRAKLCARVASADGDLQ